MRTALSEIIEILLIYQGKGVKEMLHILKEILAELKAIRLILAPSSANNNLRLIVIPDDHEQNKGSN